MQFIRRKSQNWQLHLRWQNNRQARGHSPLHRRSAARTRQSRPDPKSIRQSHIGQRRTNHHRSQRPPNVALLCHPSHLARRSRQCRIATRSNSIPKPCRSMLTIAKWRHTIDSMPYTRQRRHTWPNRRLLRWRRRHRARHH